MAAFDPDAYLKAKEQEREAGNPAPVTTPPNFDPDAYIKDNGIQLPAPETVAGTAPQQSTTAGEAAAEGVASGLSIGGLGRDLAPFVAAIPSSSVDKELGRTYTDRLLMAKGQIDQQQKAAQEEHPLITAAAQIVSSIPKFIGLTGGLSQLGVAGVANQNTAIGGLEGLTQSKKTSIPKTLGEIGISALGARFLTQGMGATLGALSKSAEEAGVSLSSSYDEFGNIMKSTVAPKVEKLGDEILKINYDPGLKQSFEVGREMQAALTNPNTKAQIRDELNAQPQAISNILKDMKDRIGSEYDDTISQYPDAKGSLTGAFQKGLARVDKVYAKSDVSVEKAKDALKELMTDRIEDLSAKHGSLDEVPLSDMAALKQDMGNLIFEQKAYKKSGTDAVHRAASQFWGDITDAVKQADPSGGKLSKIDEVFKAAYGMENDMPTGSNLLSLTNPKSPGPSAGFDEFLAHWAKVNPETRALYGKDLTNYIQNDFANSIGRAQLMQAVDKEASPNLKAISFYIPFSDTFNIKYANKLGSILGPKAPPAFSFEGLANPVVNRQTLAPSLANQGSKAILGE